MPRESQPSDRPSSTSPHTSSRDDGPAHAALLDLIEGLPADRLEPVFTHTSWAVSRDRSYERLEFVGDSVLGLAIARELYERFPEYPEGHLAKLRAHVVSRQSCAVVGARLDLGAKLVERGGDSIPAEELERLSVNRNVLAALVEAALGALYLEHGFEPIRTAVLAAFQDQIEYALTTYVDYKTELQEEVARRTLTVSYTVVDVEGPPHDRRFTCAAVVGGEQAGVGHGASKKAAEQNAAREALERIRSS
ncbi:MAG: ribonuclease III [Thermoleophilia bacterium]|nr:ribonuclease III [Thermoleophilia bacterium]